MSLRYYQKPKSRSLRFRGNAFGLFTISILGLTAILGNLLQLFSLCIYPFSKPAFRTVNCSLAGCWWGLCVYLGRLARMRVNLHVDNIPQGENILLFANHQSMVDIPALFHLALSKKRLSNLKWFVKDIVKYVPGIGFGMLFLGCLFVKREWSKDQNRVEKTFTHINRTNIDFWLIIFSEGTRFHLRKLDRTRRLTAKYGLEPFRNVLFPATRGFSVSVDKLRNRLDAIYDVTIFYPEGIPKMWDYLCGYIKQIEVYVTRFPITTLPNSNRELISWLVARFTEKDNLIEELKAAHYPPRVETRSQLKPTILSKIWLER